MTDWIKRIRRRSLTLPVIVLLLGLGLGLSIAGAIWHQHTIDADIQGEFERSSARVAAEIAQRFNRPLQGLNGAKGLYAAPYLAFVRRKSV